MTNNEKDLDPVLIDVPMPIRTPRLILRPVQPGDGAEAHEAKEETWDMLAKWMPWATEDQRGADLTESHIRKAYAKFIMREDIMIVGEEREGGRPVIWTGLHRFDWQARHFEIGYWVRKTAQGKGYATESTNALIRYAFNALRARRVEINHAAGNAASAAVIRKLGFVQEGILRQEMKLPDGTFDDRVTYARLDAAGLPDLDVSWGPP